MPYTAKQVRFFRVNNIPYDENAPIIKKYSSKFRMKEMKPYFKPSLEVKSNTRLTKLTMKLKTKNFQLDKKRGAKNTFIVTRLNKPKEKFKIGNTTYILS